MWTRAGPIQVTLRVATFLDNPGVPYLTRRSTGTFTPQTNSMGNYMDLYMVKWRR